MRLCEHLSESLTTTFDCVASSSQLTSLKFLSNLRRIHGNPLEDKHYAIILYDNKQLQDLWQPTVQLELVNGGMFMHRNNKLCNQHILEFQTRVVHDKMMNSLQTSDQEVLCGPAKLQLSAKVWTQCTFYIQIEYPFPSRFVHIVQCISDGLKPKRAKN